MKLDSITFDELPKDALSSPAAKAPKEVHGFCNAWPCGDEGR